MFNYIKKLFCRHKWELIDSERCNILNAINEKVGEVTINYYKCKKCNAEKIIPTNKMMICQS